MSFGAAPAAPPLVLAPYVDFQQGTQELEARADIADKFGVREIHFLYDGR